MINDLLDIVFININTNQAHLVIILSIFFITWKNSLFGGFLIDDDMGIQQFSERWQPEIKDATGKITQEEKLIDSYKEGDKDHKFLKYLPHLGFPGCFMRWHRLHIGKKYSVVGKNKKGHDVYGFTQDPLRHHVWSLFWYSLCLVLSYNFLDYQFGKEIAFSATLLFAVHPIISQSVAWISGINYIYCLFFLLANYNFLQLGLNYYWTIPATIFLTWASSLSVLVGCFNFAVLWVLGYNWEAFSALVIGVLVLLTQGSWAVDYRRNEFKKQNMEASITPNIRKPIVMLKTLWYYICLVVYPKSLGLYHVFGYHYSRKMEEPDSKFWLGLISLILMGYGFFYGDSIIRLSIVWFLSYLIVFSNYITANQFVVDRYSFIPSLAFCIIFGKLLYPYPPLFWLLVGLYMMRSIMHIWTYKDHVSFYTSNIHNFPNSEVAYGNLGVAYQSSGRSGTAFDCWIKATDINKFYDVPWYNMHSLVKGAGQLEQARIYLDNCLNGTIVHFKEGWEKESKLLDEALLKKKLLEDLNRQINEAIQSGKTELIPELKKKIDLLLQPGTVVQQVPNNLNPKS